MAIGTGRIGLPLRGRGVPVHGIEQEQYKFQEVLGGRRRVYLVFNTIGNLTTQDEQVACFRNAAAHLEPGGHFVIEVVVPDLRRLPPGESAQIFARSPGYVGFDEYTDLVGQVLWSHHWQHRRPGRRGVLDAVPLRLAVRARPHGLPRRHAAP